MRELWTSEVPTKNGFYWWKMEEALNEEVVQLHEGIVMVTGSGAKFPIDHWKDQRWGPIIPSARMLEALGVACRRILAKMIRSYRWLPGLEYAVWDKIHKPSKRGPDERKTQQQIATLAVATNGWAVMGDDDEDPKWIPMSEWEAILAKRKDVNSE